MYHAPKIAELDLEGMEGEVQDIVKFYNGQELSATLPYKVAFTLPVVEGARAKKFICHLVRPGWGCGLPKWHATSASQ